MGLRSAIQNTYKLAKDKPQATILFLAFQGAAAIDQFQYEAAHNTPEDFSLADVAEDIIIGNLFDFDPIFQHIDRAMQADEPCANHGQIFNNSINWALENDPSGIAEIGEIFVRFSHWSSIPGAEVGSFAYESYDTAMKFFYNKEDREPGACIVSP